MTQPVTGYTDLLDRDIADEIKSYPPQLEVGATGLKRSGGYIQEEFLPQLRGRKAIKIYREMQDNSAVVAAWMYTVTQLIRQIEWRVEPGSSSSEDQKIAEFVEENMHDMENSWGDFISEVCSMLAYGWSVHEMVFKRRAGEWARNKANQSKFDDGKIGWRKFPIRAQESLLRWVFADNGDVEAMVQMPAPKYQRIVLPMKKCLLFRTALNRGSPEGRSLLRPMYRSYFMLKRFEEIEAIGIERDLAGMPVAYVPTEVLNAKPGSKNAKMLEGIKKAVTSVRRNEQEGLIWPLEYDDDKNLMYDFKLQSSGGSRQFNIDQVIQRYETRMLMAAMADFIMTGHENAGSSYALHTDKSGIFETGVNGVALAVAEPINRTAIPRLLALNGIRPERLPRIVPNDVNPPDLSQLGALISATTNAGMEWFPDGDLEKFIRDSAKLPQQDPEVTEAHDEEQRQKTVLGLMQQKMEMLQTKMQAQQAATEMEGSQQQQADGRAKAQGQQEQQEAQRRVSEDARSQRGQGGGQQ